MAIFPQAGDICKECKPRWEARKLPPKRLVALPTTTEKQHNEVVVCPFCDSDQIIKLAEKNKGE